MAWVEIMASRMRIARQYPGNACALGGKEAKGIEEKKKKNLGSTKKKNTKEDDDGQNTSSRVKSAKHKKTVGTEV